VRAIYAATLHSRRLQPLAPGQPAPRVPDLSKAEAKLALGAAGQMDFEAAEFKKWLKALKLQKAQAHDEVAFARDVYRIVHEHIAYKYDPEQDRHASKLCGGKTTDCGGMSVLFTAVMRANQVPARCLVGRWARSAKADDKLDGTVYYQWHVKAEFFARGVGWVPVDVAGNAFGDDPGDFLVMHIDPDLMVDTKHFGQKTITWAQGPVFWVSGAGKLDKGNTVEDWKVRKLP
jgi:transglutaminase-like putative cysteine protease